MCNDGRILMHLSHFAPEKSILIMLDGWQCTGTQGRQLVEGVKSITFATPLR